MLLLPKPELLAKDTPHIGMRDAALDREIGEFFASEDFWRGVTAPRHCADQRSYFAVCPE